MPPKQNAQNSQDAAHAAWLRQTAAMQQRAAGVDWSGVDWSKLNPRDIGVTFGPPMTEEQFKAYKARRAASGQAAPTVVKHTMGAGAPPADGAGPGH